MNILLNTLNIGLGTVYHTAQPLSGLEKPPIRESSANFAGKDGGYLAAQFYSMRDISIQGQILSDTIANHETHRKTLENSMPIRQLFDAQFTMPSGDKFYALVFLKKLDFDITKPTASRFKIELRAPDPILYAGGTSPLFGLQDITVDKLDTSGTVLPWILPVTLGAEAYTTLANNGDIEVFPTIVCSGRFTNPRIYNMRTNSIIKVNVSTSTGDVLIIDMKEKTITLNGVSVLPYLSTQGGFWSLQPGNNDLYLETDSGSDVSSVQVQYRHAYSGI